MVQHHMKKNKSAKLRRSRQVRGSIRWCAEHLGVSHSHLIRVRDGERPNVNQLLERFNQLKGTR
jgi:hypothetical protein